jgi:hypothetical protein
VLIATLACLFTPAMYHQIAERGRPTTKALNMATVFASAALLPFSAALVLSMAASQLLRGWTAVVLGAVAFAVTLFLWYGLELVHRRNSPRRSRTARRDDREGEGTIKDRIDHVLTEARTILPGAQALLGFQLITMLSEAFERLPLSSRYIHFSSLLSIALSTVLLLTPAAYHPHRRRRGGYGAVSPIREPCFALRDHSASPGARRCSLLLSES